MTTSNSKRGLALVGLATIALGMLASVSTSQAQIAGLYPVNPVAGLYPSRPVAGLYPSRPAAGLYPVRPAAGLYPSRPPAGLSHHK